LHRALTAGKSGQSATSERLEAVTAARVTEATTVPIIRTGGAVGAGAFRYTLIAPAVFILLAFGLFPFLYAVVVSFQKLSLLDQYTSFQGFLNYARLFQDQRLWNAVLHTLAITAVALPLQLVLGLLLAHHFLAERPLKRLFVALLIIPSVISPMVAGSMWRLMFDDRYGPINQIIGWILGEHVSILWTIQAAWAYPAIIICDVWEWTPFMFIILLAALSNVDGEQLDAAAIDGANAWQSFRYVSLPAIWPVMMIALLIRGLDLVRLFDLVWQLTRGGPGSDTETISIYMFVRGFQEFETSYAGAMVVVLLILFTAALVVALRRMEIAR
jgi:multiple sugar transport system permease protein